MNELTNMLAGAKPAASQAAALPEGAAGAAAAINAVATEDPNNLAALLMGGLTGIELEAVVGGALMKLQFGPGLNPAGIKAGLLAMDPAAKVRDDFPKRGNFGNRDTKTTRCVTILVKVTDAYKFFDLVCQNGDDIKVTVSKKKADSFPSDLAALGKLTEKNIAKIQEAVEGKKEATVILGEGEQFGVNYWASDDGKAFMDSLTPEPPAHDAEKTEDKKS